ncbi:MAG TPA: adenylosuccinate synthase [Candidatus Sulfotelmatobacter sp.]|jgi:adenylosuccinate synthase|nr:adenylosuccinate synthase [Candidatus Sulfotelmatobacter sp.]
MANTILIGAQWGDEGKGKIIDVLTAKADIVVRSQGGNNAGHTVIHRGATYILHLIPSGILRRGKICVIGNGVVVDPIALVAEIEGLRKLGITIGKNLLISDCAHLVLPYHRLLDEERELRGGGAKIGTTKRGIGPAYGDKAARTGLRMSDLIQPIVFSKKLQAKVIENNRILQALGAKPISFREVNESYLAAGEKLRPFIENTVVYLHRALERGKEILFEGAQGTFLDIDHGTYPYVTSSNTTAGGACTGTGVPPHRMDRVVGVMKAYTTRVGEGALPTEDRQFTGRLHKLGREFGATTGRKRRCGWFDVVATHYATMINGIDELAITNLDGLDHVDPIRVCVAYRLNGKRLNVPPSDATQLANCKPVYQQLRGWSKSTRSARKLSQLPSAAQDYVKYIANLTGGKLSMVSVGPERGETIIL